MEWKEIKQELLNASIEVDVQGIGNIKIIAEQDFDNLAIKIKEIYDKGFHDGCEHARPAY